LLFGLTVNLVDQDQFTVIAQTGYDLCLILFVFGLFVIVAQVA
jgi:hypothetical protein